MKYYQKNYSKIFQYIQELNIIRFIEKILKIILKYVTKGNKMYMTKVPIHGGEKNDFGWI